MRSGLLRTVTLTAWLALPAGAMAADIFDSPGPAHPGGQCVGLERTPLLGLPPADLAQALVQLYADAVLAAERPEIIYSARPAFTWALETRNSCGKAIGYLKTSTVDAIEISKCACFHQRMVHFLP